MAIGLERLRQLLPSFKPEKKPVLTLSSCLDSIIKGEPYRYVLFDIRSNPDLTPFEKKALIDGLQNKRHPTWEWKFQNGKTVLRGENVVPQA